MPKPNKPLDFTQSHCYFTKGSAIKLAVKERLAKLDRDKNALLDQLKAQIKNIDDAVILFMTINLANNTDSRTILTKLLAQESAKIQTTITQLEMSARNLEDDIMYALSPDDIEWYGL